VKRSVEKVSVEAINNQIKAFIDEQQWSNRYPDLRWWIGGELEQQQDTMGNMEQAFVICLLSIFALLIILFNSLSQPLLIMICIPFGLLGVVIGYGVQGLELGIMSLVGIIGLIGVLVNDSLVLVHTLNRRGDGRVLSLQDIAEVAQQRFRPILITSITTVVGLLPTAYGIMGSNSYITPMVMAMAWGVMFGGFVSLILLPCLYAVHQDFTGVIARLLRREQAISADIQ